MCGPYTFMLQILSSLTLVTHVQFVQPLLDSRRETREKGRVEYPWASNLHFLQNEDSPSVQETMNGSIHQTLVIWSLCSMSPQGDLKLKKISERKEMRAADKRADAEGEECTAGGEGGQEEEAC